MRNVAQFVAFHVESTEGGQNSFLPLLRLQQSVSLRSNVMPKLQYERKVISFLDPYRMVHRLLRTCTSSGLLALVLRRRPRLALDGYHLSLECNELNAVRGTLGSFE